MLGYTTNLERDCYEMNRKQRRAAAKGKPKALSNQYKVIPVTYPGEAIMAMRTRFVRAAYKQWMDIFLMSVHDEDDLEFQSYPNHMGKLDRLERRVREEVNSLDDIADFDTAIEYVSRVYQCTGLTINLGHIDRSSLNTRNMIGKKYTYTAQALDQMKNNCFLAALGIYLSIFLLEVYKMTGYVSLESGDSPLDRLVTRIFHNNIDSINDKYAQLEFSDFDWALKYYCNGFTTPGLN